MSRYIEFCGLPGSGKSTLCAGAVAALNGRGRTLVDRSTLVSQGLRHRDFGWLGNFLGRLAPGWRHRFLGLPHGLGDWHRFAVDHPAFVALCQGWLSEGNDEAWISAVYYALLTSAFEYRLARSSAGLVLMDEGLAQRLHSFRGYGGRAQPGDAGRYAELMPRPDALVLVQTPPEVCNERLGKRPAPLELMREDTETNRLMRLTQGQALLDELAARLEQRGVPVLRTAGAGSLEAGIAEVAAFVEKVLPTEGADPKA
jgi:thymidylate kinase